MRLGVGVALLALAACSSQRQPDAKPSPRPTATARVPAAAELTGAAIPAPELAGATNAAGQWSGDAAAAMFGRAGAPTFAIRCDGGAIRVIRYGATGSAMTLATDTGAATYPASAVAGGATATIMPTDSFLDVLLKPGGTLGVRLGDGATLAMPLDARVGAVVRTCRRPHG